MLKETNLVTKRTFSKDAEVETGVYVVQAADTRVGIALEDWGTPDRIQATLEASYDGGATFEFLCGAIFQAGLKHYVTGLPVIPTILHSIEGKRPTHCRVRVKSLDSSVDTKVAALAEKV